MAEIIREEGEDSPSSTCCGPSSHPLTVARIVKAIAYLSDRGGSTVHDISRALENQYGFRSSNSDLKQMLIRAVKSERVKRVQASNRFVVGLGASSSRSGNYNCRGRGRRRRGSRRRGKGGKKKGKKGKGRRRRRRGKKRKGKKKKGKKGKRRRRRRRKKGKK